MHAFTDEQAPDERARDEVASVFRERISCGPYLALFPREHRDGAAISERGAEQVALANASASPFEESDTTTVSQWRTGKRTSCASADGPESSLFHHAQGSEGASHTPVRRSRSETPCARAWIQQAVAAWGVRGARLTHCRQALGSLGRSGGAAERTLLVSVEPVIQTRSNSGPCRTTECRGARACHPESFRHPRE